MARFKIPIIHEDERFVVIDKPSGLLSVPGKGLEKQDCAVWRVRLMYPRARGPMVVHRLDMETSGLMVVALDEDAQRQLSMQFEGRQVEKSYAALLEGSVEGETGEVRLPLRADLQNRPRQIVDFEHGMRAHTSWRVLAREIDRTRVEFRPVTGRTHQLRVHAATARDAFGERGGGLGCPIVGDGLYGTTGSGARLMLHAAGLSFLVPGGSRRLDFVCPAPF